MRILSPHDNGIFVEVADDVCPRYIWILRVECAVLLVVTILLILRRLT